jgi:enediyne biosynthesis protein E4
MAGAVNANTQTFVNHTGSADFGLTAPHGFDRETWMAGGNTFEPVMMTGGASAAYLDDDCWPDIVYAGGDASGLVFYRNRGDQLGYQAEAWVSAALRTSLGTRLSGIGTADLNGDYRRELVVGNIVSDSVAVLAAADSGMYYRIAALNMSRHTFGISFGLLGASPYPSLYLAHWSGNGVPGTAPAFFFNDGGTRLLPYDGKAKTSSAYVDQSFNFTPKFADFNGDGMQDIVLASDFGTSQVLQNDDEKGYTNVTDDAVITDENGMGSALLDFDNDGKLDWFVTSIHDPEGTALGNWGGTGNRLYRNVSTGTQVAFEDVTSTADVRDGAWGWGACAADFNLDGFIDLFHVNGFGLFPDDVLPTGGESAKPYFIEATQQFVGVSSRLFINAGDGTFDEQAAAWGINVPSEGRGVACFDYDRDGDLDILLLDHSTGLQFFENQVGHDADHGFLNVRLVGAPPNTDALGARVTVVADVGHGHGVQTQLRTSEANSNFNSQNLPDMVFGLGAATGVSTLTVTWPNDPTPLVCSDVAVNQFAVFDQRDKQCPVP